MATQIFVPNKGERYLLQYGLGTRNLKLKLFINNPTIDENVDESSFVEMSSLGYTDKTIQAANWTFATDGSGNTTAMNQLQNWTFGAGVAVTAYGVILVDSATGALVFGQKFPDPVVIGNTDQTVIEVTPLIGAD